MTIDWITVGDPGNLPDTIVATDGTTGYGSVSYTYSIARYEVTNAQYAEFLNAKAASDPLGLYNTNMGEIVGGIGGITRSGTPGSYSYSPLGGRGDKPVTWVSVFDAMRFANWLHNGQGDADTETGAYLLLGGTEMPSNGATVTRTPGASIFLPSEDEWYKAAYYDAASSSYFEYPTRSDVRPLCTTPGDAPNTANCASRVGTTTFVGAYTGSASPYGTFDQGGNAGEWSDTIAGHGSEGINRVARGGTYAGGQLGLGSSKRVSLLPSDEYGQFGFRVAAVIPEPETSLLVMAGLVGVAARRRARG